MGDYDKDTAFIGQSGRYFWAAFFLLNTVFISTGFTGLYIVFVGAVPPHHCLIPHQANLTAEWRAVIVPTETAASGEERLSRCSRYKLDVVSNLSALGLIPGRDINLTDVALEGCVDGWSYSQDIFKSTIVTEWDLVCGDSWKVPFASSTLFMGFLIGSLISGQLSDRFGRKKVLFVSLAAQFVFVFLQSLSTSWILFCITFLFIGAAQIALYISAFVLGTELLSKSMRVLFTTLGTFLFYCIGYMLLPWLAYCFRDWRTLLAVISSFSLAYIPLWWFISESPRWLLSQGRVAEAEFILRHAAKKNKVEAPEVIFKESGFGDGQKIKKYTIIDVLKSRKLRLITLLCLTLWMSVNIGYFGLSLNTSNLSGDPYMNCFLSACTEVPAHVMSTLLLRNYPRRALLSSFLIIGGGFLLLVQFIPESLHGLTLAMVLTGKFGFTMAFSVVYIYTAELYPTVLRNIGIGMCSSAARIGSITAPYVIYLGTYNKFLPYILMGSITVGSAVVNVFLPETLNKQLPETVEEMQECQGICRRTGNKSEDLEKKDNISRHNYTSERVRE